MLRKSAVQSSSIITDGCDALRIGVGAGATGPEGGLSQSSIGFCIACDCAGLGAVGGGGAGVERIFASSFRTGT